MRTLLVPGMWLAADAWQDVIPLLQGAGHDARAITLPGQESAEAAQAETTFDDWVDAVVAQVDAADGPVALVGHSAAGAVVSVAADRRSDRIGAVIYVDSFPFPEGDYENDEFPVTDGVIPFPARSGFSAEMLRETDGDAWDRLVALARPVPGGIARTSFRFHDPARHRIPSTVIISEMPPEALTAAIASGAPWTSELGASDPLRIVGLDTGHWAMLTRPRELAALIAEAIPQS
ncbi:alpha/beta fold hydrolase [Curtobacterium ammoniigenes]|uniref:alpha/beta fold hydrolase n=1 Tax=Curtobacterium ammoniigenes TaxID=395387 RepID=UPI00082C074A|nr:alpha/beta fold hydrolase [Curtobacterium ammoniigenes]